MAPLPGLGQGLTWASLAFLAMCRNFAQRWAKSKPHRAQQAPPCPAYFLQHQARSLTVFSTTLFPQLQRQQASEPCTLATCSLFSLFSFSSLQVQPTLEGGAGILCAVVVSASPCLHPPFVRFILGSAVGHRATVMVHSRPQWGLIILLFKRPTGLVKVTAQDE